MNINESTAVSLPAASQELMHEFDAIIEISMNSDPVKYEIDKESGKIVVNRFMQTAMFYPCNYGFIPNTLSLDEDPLDVLVISHYPIIPGAMIKTRPIGVLIMEDDGGIDEKIVVVPVSKVDSSFDKIKDIDDLCPMLKNRIFHFFEHYKKLEPGKWTKITGWKDIKVALKLVTEAYARNINN